MPEAFASSSPSKALFPLTSSTLHLYCAEGEAKEAKTEKNFAEENKAAARILVRNAFHTLKRGGSAVDFQVLNNLFNLVSDYQDIVVTTKTLVVVPSSR